VSPVRYELGFFISEDDILHSHHCENLKSYNSAFHEHGTEWPWMEKIPTNVQDNVPRKWFSLKDKQ
jgi:hypothetical protein